MQALRHWSFGKVLLVAAAWFVVSLAVTLGWIIFQSTRVLFDSSEGAGVAAVSIGINEAFIAIPVIPPVVLIVAWLVNRLR